METSEWEREAQKFGRLDILVNNAGIRKYEKVDEARAASWSLPENLQHLPPKRDPAAKRTPRKLTRSSRQRGKSVAVPLRPE